jgi:hypothetical protein
VESSDRKGRVLGPQLCVCAIEPKKVRKIRRSEKPHNHGHFLKPDLVKEIGRIRKAAARRKRARDRREAGIMVVPVEVDGPVLDLLIRMGWLKEADAEDPVKVGLAIHGGLMRSS